MTQREQTMNIQGKRIAVYCGSSNRVDQSYTELAFEVGRQLKPVGKSVWFTVEGMSV